VESTYSWLDGITARRGDAIERGQVIGRSGAGHTGSLVPHLHLGVRLLDVYVDPLDYLGPIEVWRFIRLAPVHVS
jgi:murein DD-endopeptidase MepM/ murein hydrolase activator NlpD